MCGISAVLSWTDAGEPFAGLRAMVQAQAHRGPDGFGFAIWPDAGTNPPLVWRAARYDRTPPAWARLRVGLGHNLLAIQDVTPAALQPMADAASRYWIVYNGEIYNFPELRADLIADGVTFRSLTDTEVLLALWTRHGPDTLSRLRGMFALVVYDTQDDVLWVARDRFGIKPVYYAHSRDGLIVASEFRGIHASGLVPRRWDDEALLAFLAAGVNKPDDAATFFEGVLELPPGCFLRARPGEVRVRRYYTLPELDGAEAGEECMTEFRERFSETVAMHLRSVREVGACVSGGLDSSSIACAAVTGGGARAAFQSFTIGSAESLDARLADTAARSLGLRHHFVPAPASLAVADLVDMIEACETPNHTWGPINQYLLLRAIATGHGLRVLLDGQGGDEVLSGYPWFVPAVSEFVARRFGHAAGEALSRAYVDRLPLPPHALKTAQSMYTSRRHWIELFDGGAANALGVSRDEVVRWRPVQYFLNDALDWNGMRGHQIFRRELAHFLRHEDRLGMWHSIECRVPFLDHELVEFMAGFDPRFLFKQGYAKYPLRILFPELPEAVRFETRKTGYWESYSQLPAFEWPMREMIDSCDVLRKVVRRTDGPPLSPLAAWRFFQVAVLSGGYGGSARERSANEVGEEQPLGGYEH
jgi:asparagine synthase (glutamine-hydrolysing)